MVDWPDLDELKLRLDVESSDHDVTLANDLAAGIAYVKRDVGRWDELTDLPDESESAAALRAAELIATRPEGQAGVSSRIGADPTYNSLLAGHRRRFAIA